MKRLYEIILLAVLAFIIIGVVDFFSNHQFDVFPQKMNEVLNFFIVEKFGEKSKKGIVKIDDHIFEVEIADKPLVQIKGLSGRPFLKENEGMLFVFSQPGLYSIWMKGMRFPIDAIWIYNNEVVEIKKNLPVPKGDVVPLYRPKEIAQYILELREGTVEKFGIKEGDKVKIEFKD